MWDRPRQSMTTVACIYLLFINNLIISFIKSTWHQNGGKRFAHHLRHLNESMWLSADFQTRFKDSDILDGFYKVFRCGLVFEPVIEFGVFITLFVPPVCPVKLCVLFNLAINRLLWLFELLLIHPREQRVCLFSTVIVKCDMIFSLCTRLRNVRSCIMKILECIHLRLIKKTQ